MSEHAECHNCGNIKFVVEDREVRCDNCGHELTDNPSTSTLRSSLLDALHDHALTMDALLDKRRVCQQHWDRLNVAERRAAKSYATLTAAESRAQALEKERDEALRMLGQTARLRDAHLESAQRAQAELAEMKGPCGPCRMAEARAEAAESESTRLKAERDGWMEDAARHWSNEDFYRGLVYKIGELFGVEARTSDDGSVQQDVLALKVPELVTRLREREKVKDEAAGIIKELFEAGATSWSRWPHFMERFGKVLAALSAEPEGKEAKT